MNKIRIGGTVQRKGLMNPRFRSKKLILKNFRRYGPKVIIPWPEGSEKQILSFEMKVQPLCGMPEYRNWNEWKGFERQLNLPGGTVPWTVRNRFNTPIRKKRKADRGNFFKKKQKCPKLQILLAFLKKDDILTRKWKLLTQKNKPQFIGLAVSEAKAEEIRECGANPQQQPLPWEKSSRNAYRTVDR